MDIVIKRVLPADIVSLQTIGRQTFYETFADQNSSADMQAYLDNNLSLDKLTTELADNNSQFYFALLDNNIIGYLKINFGDALTEIKHAHSIEIERIYVLKEFHGIGIGQLLYDKAIDIARQKRIDYVWLGVWEKNRRAISFYKRNGFVEFDKHVFQLGSDKQTDILMKLLLH